MNRSDKMINESEFSFSLIIGFAVEDYMCERKFHLRLSAGDLISDYAVTLKDLARIYE